MKNRLLTHIAFFGLFFVADPMSKPQRPRTFFQKSPKSCAYGLKTASIFDKALHWLKTHYKKGALLVGLLPLPFIILLIKKKLELDLEKYYIEPDFQWPCNGKEGSFTGVVLLGKKDVDLDKTNFERHYDEGDVARYDPGTLQEHKNRKSTYEKEVRLWDVESLEGTSSGDIRT